MAEASDIPSKKCFLRSAKIVKLWGYRTVELDFRPDVNILIGKNGSGKTTVLNLIANILLIDFDALAKVRFDSIDLQFDDPETGLSPRLNIVSVRRNSLLSEEGFEIKAYSKSRARNPVAEQKISYHFRPNIPSLGMQRSYSSILGLTNRSLEPINSSIVAFINDITRVTWISVHRKLAAPKNENSFASFDSSVDERLEQISIRFSEFVTARDNEIAKATSDFQKKLLTSLMLTLPNADLSAKRLKRVRLKSLHQVILNILGDLELDMPETDVQSFFLAAEHSISTVIQGNAPPLLDLLTSSYILQIEKIVDIWSKYSKFIQSVRIKKYKILFKLDDLLVDKDANLDGAGRVVFEIKGQSVPPITPQALSSGEKQLFILLMEALLQSETPSIFIADEPELSLHILWQEKLIGAMRGLNENAQLIFATHSPDLVGSYTAAVRDMDENGTDNSEKN